MIEMLVFATVPLIVLLTGGPVPVPVNENIFRDVNVGDPSLQI